MRGLFRQGQKSNPSSQQDGGDHAHGKEDIAHPKMKEIAQEPWIGLLGRRGMFDK